MSLFSVFASSISSAIAANPGVLTNVSSAVTAATATFQSQVQSSVQPASDAVTAASKLLPQLKAAIGMGSVDAIKSISGQIVGIPNITNDVKSAALNVMMFASDPKLPVFFGMLSDTIAADVATQANIGKALGVNITPIF